jgi:membrane protein required for colicin V production
MNLATTDWLLCAVLLLSMLLGAWRGLVYELMSLVAWVAAFVLAQWLAQDVAQLLPFLQSAAEKVQYAAAFVLVFVLTLFAAGLLSWLLKKVVETVGLRPVDRALGALFGVARGVLLLLVATVVVQLLGMASQPWWQEAQGPVWLDVLLNGLKPVLPESLRAYLPHRI